MKIIRIWLLILAALVLATPLLAEEIDAPETHWRAAVADESATVNWARVDVDADEIAASQSAQPAASENSSGQAGSTATSESQPASTQEAEQKKHEEAEEQLKQQEKQRILGIVPSFNVSYNYNAVSLTAGQKMRLAFRSSIDPVTFAGAFLVAGYHEAANDLTGFPWGPSGYFERAGAAYLDVFDGNMIGNGILPAVLHQDPRYFRLGHGSTTHRILYSIATNFVCRHDNTGKWEPNYSNVLGNIASGAISNLYYPNSNSGIGLTLSNGMIVTAEGTVGSIFNEFWPDISRKLLHKDPTHGADAQNNSAGNAASERRGEKP